SAPLVETVGGLHVTSFTPTATGFQAAFDGTLNPSVLNLYDDSPASFGQPDVLFTNQGGSALEGSLLLGTVNGHSQVTFVLAGQTGLGQGAGPVGVLPTGTYTVVLRSASNAFVD